MENAGGLSATTPATFLQDAAADTGRPRLGALGVVASGGEVMGGLGREGPVLACQTTESASELLHASETIGEGPFLLLQIWESFKGKVFFSWDAPVFTCDLCKMFQARTRLHFMPQTYFLSW